MRILIAAFLVLSFSHASFADDRSVTVTGHCLKSIQPDRGSVDFFADSVNLDSAKAVSTATKTFENARDAVKKLNLKNLELSTIENSLNEERPWENNKSVFKGYRSRIGLRVYTSEISRLSEVMASVGKQGIKSFGGLQSDLSPAKMKEELESCLEISIQNARTKAEKMAKAAGAKIGKVLTMQEGSQNAEPAPRMYMAKSMMGVAGSAENATIDTKAESISMNVTVTYSLE